MLLTSLLVGISGLCAVLFGHRAGPLGFPLDDAWIHLVYARSLAEDGMLAYAPGVPGSGCTAPGWALLLAPLHAALSPHGVGAVIWGVRCVGSAFFLGSVVLAGDYALRRSGREVVGLVAALGCAFTSTLAMAAFSGMEVTAAGCAMLAALHARAENRPLMAGLAMAAAGSFRPESVPPMIVLGLEYVLATRRDSGLARRVALLGLPSVAVGALLVAHNLDVSGHPLPATFYLKQNVAPPRFADRIVEVVRDVYGRTAPYVGYVAFLPHLALGRGGVARLERLPSALATVFLGCALVVIAPNHGIGFYFTRYFMPAAPLLAVGFALGSAQLLAVTPPRYRPLAVGLALLYFVPLTVVSSREHAFRLHNDIRNIDEIEVRMGRDLARLAAPHQRIAVSDAGAIRYFSDRETVDLLGLNNLAIVEDHIRFVATHPVAYVAFMPAWGVPLADAPLRAVARYRTQHYTVLEHSRQDEQWIVACTRRGRVPFFQAGQVRFDVLCDPDARR